MLWDIQYFFRGDNETTDVFDRDFFHFDVTAAVTQRFTTCPNTRCLESSGQQIYAENGEDIHNFIGGTRPKNGCL